MEKPTPNEIDAAEIILDSNEGEYSWMEDLDEGEENGDDRTD